MTIIIRENTTRIKINFVQIRQIQVKITLDLKPEGSIFPLAKSITCTREIRGNYQNIFRLESTRWRSRDKKLAKKRSPNILNLNSFHWHKQFFLEIYIFIVLYFKKKNNFIGVWIK